MLRMSPSRQFRDEWLVPIARDAHHITDQVIESARGAGHPFLASALLRRGLTADALGASVEQRHGWPFVMPRPADVDRALLKTVPERLCRQHAVVPLRIEASRIHVASANPGDLRVVDELRFATGRTPV